VTEDVPSSRPDRDSRPDRRVLGRRGKARCAIVRSLAIRRDKPAARNPRACRLRLIRCYTPISVNDSDRPVEVRRCSADGTEPRRAGTRVAGVGPTRLASRSRKKGGSRYPGPDRRRNSPSWRLPPPWATRFAVGEADLKPLEKRQKKGQLEVGRERVRRRPAPGLIVSLGAGGRVGGSLQFEPHVLHESGGAV
jgi:hypothetical protein